MGGKGAPRFGCPFSLPVMKAFQRKQEGEQNNVFYLFICFLNFIFNEVHLIYSVVVISAVQ